MTTAVIVQARMGSTRLPGKVLQDLAGRTVLAHVLGRCARIPSADVLCCAVPDTVESDPVAAEAQSCGATVVRGSETDLLRRYHDAASALGATVILRVTSDCPLIDPQVAERVLALRAAEDADYAANNMPPSWPHGLDCEAITYDALCRAALYAEKTYEREHVTPWLRTAPGIRRVNLVGPGGDYAAQRWTLDYPQDLVFFRALFEHLPHDRDALPDMEQVMTVLRRYPEFAEINRRHQGDRAIAPYQR